ncbi:MAG TPA: sulfite exporter TauE/SafE family protein [Thermoleophilaceae bacterium]|nr:sulfite exporter TauE/SafE family protein [Thermoleophilaceae bacterium]
MLLAIPFGLAIGLVVGGVGGGGAILALPVLVYVLGEPVSPASTSSLIVVALAAAVGAGSLARHGHVCWRLALTFSLPAAAGSYAGTVANRAVSGQVLILTFVPIMLLAAGATWQRTAGAKADELHPCPPVGAGPIVLSGVAVGVLTGFFGVGGGFMIVPVLTLWFGVGFRRAVATSLVIITLTGGAALGIHLAKGATLDVPITVALAGSTAIGAVCGTLVAQRLPQGVLGRGFALMVAAVAVFLLVDTLAFGGPPGH